MIENLAYLNPFNARSASRLSRVVDARLSALIHDARQYSPYYARMLGRDVCTQATLIDLPTLSRTTLQTYLPEITRPLARGERLLHLRTSGSTGRPLELPVIVSEAHISDLLWLRLYTALGLRPWHVQGKFSHTGPRPARWIQRFGILRRSYCPAAAWPTEKVDWLREVRPHALFGWASLLGEVARELESQQDAVEIPMIFSSSDMLWDGLRRQIIERLGGQVRDVYGAEETGPIAWECPVGGGYHVRQDWVYIELLDDDDRPASSGRVVCTVLWRRLTPLIRYEIGDAAEWADEPCACGSPFPRLKKLHGRQQDLMPVPGGGWISAGTLESLIYGLQNIRQFQFVQQSAKHLKLRLVLAHPPLGRDEATIVARFLDRFAGRLTLGIETVDEIEKAGRAKFTPFLTLPDDTLSGVG